MQSLVYILIGLAGLGVWATAYFGLTFTPIEAFVTALCFAAIAVLLLERTLRRRAEARLERAIGELSRLLSTDAAAGATLSQRVNALAGENAGNRLNGLEADVSVLGTVVRQVAEAVADLEERSRATVGSVPPEAAPDPDTFPEPVIPLDMLRQALLEGRLVCHVAPVALLPVRRTQAYALVPRLRLEEGEFADPPEFMPRHGGADVIHEIDALALGEAIVMARRLRSEPDSLVLHVPVSRSTLEDPEASQRLLAGLEANRAHAQRLVLAIRQQEFRSLPPRARGALSAAAKSGFSLAITGATTLRVDFGELQELNVRTIGIDAHRFIDRPQTLTDFHAGDVAAYARRYGIELIGCEAIDDQQLIRLFEDGITLAQGPAIGAAGPMRYPQPVMAAAATGHRAGA